MASYNKQEDPSEATELAELGRSCGICKSMKGISILFLPKWEITEEFKAWE